MGGGDSGMDRTGQPLQSESVCPSPRGTDDEPVSNRSAAEGSEHAAEERGASQGDRVRAGADGRATRPHRRDRAPELGLSGGKEPGHAGRLRGLGQPWSRETTQAVRSSGCGRRVLQCGRREGLRMCLVF